MSHGPTEADRAAVRMGWKPHRGARAWAGVQQLKDKIRWYAVTVVTRRDENSWVVKEFVPGTDTGMTWTALDSWLYPDLSKQ